MGSEISNYVEVFKDINRIPNAVSAKVLPGLQENLVCIQSTWSSQDLVRMEKSSFVRNHVFDKKNLRILSIGLPIDASSISMRAFSKSGKRQAILQDVKSPEEKTYLEIWNETRKQATFDMTDRKEHGKIIMPANFRNLKWSSNEKYILYTAEAKKEKSLSFFMDIPPSKEEDKTVKGQEYAYIEDWGESCSGCHHSVLCLLEVESGVVEVLPTNQSSSVGQAIWGPNDEKIVFVGWDENPHRLGIVYCTNRKSGIYSICLKSKKIELITTSDNISIHDLTFSPNFGTLVFLENFKGGLHNKGSKLQKFDWTTKKISTVVDLVENASGGKFPGIYTPGFPVRCWSDDGTLIYFSTLWRSKLVIVSVNIENGQVQKLNVGDEFGTSSVLDVFDDLMIAQVSSPNSEPCLVAGLVDGNKTEWKFLDDNTPVKHSYISWEITQLQPVITNKKYPNLDYEIIVISPTERKENSPLIVVPHGGPHSCYTPAFSLRLNPFVKFGYTLCLVNYRGSIGFGENNLNSLPGNVGTQDVSDVHNAVLYLKEKRHGDGFGDVFAFCGSHGGFIGAHLTGQYPDFYKAVCLINPVIDISTMSAISDIPDWCFIEGGCGDFDRKSPSTAEQLKCMWEKSPIRYAENVTTPTLLMLGKKDLRVPMGQSIPYYQTLKARNVPVCVYQYDDDHQISKPPHDGDLFVQAAVWFRKHSSI